MELSLPVKATLGVGSAASAAAGGIYLTSSSEGSSTENQTEDTKDSDQNSTPSNKPEKDIPVTDPKTGSLYYVSEEFRKISSKVNIGNRFSLYLISPDHDETTWNKKFEALKLDNTKDQRFESVKKAKKQNDPESLSSVCLSIYKEDGESGLQKEITKDSNTIWVLNESLNNSFWKYCSYLDEAPVLMKPSSELPGSQTKIFQRHWGNFLDKTSSKNSKVWEFKEEWYKQTKDKATEEKEDLNNYLKAKQTLFKDPNTFSLQKFCEIAIEEEIEGTNIKAKTVLHYCAHDFDKFSEWY